MAEFIYTVRHYITQREAHTSTIGELEAHHSLEDAQESVRKHGKTRNGAFSIIKEFKLVRELK